MERVVDTVEIVEQAGHRRNLDDLSVVEVSAEPLEERLVDSMRIERQLPRISEGGLLLLVERTILEVEKSGDLFLTRAVPRSLRGM